MAYFYGSGSRGYIDSVNRQMSTSFYDNPERIKSRKRNQTDSDTKNEKSSNQNFIVKQQKEENDGNK